MRLRTTLILLAALLAGCSGGSAGRAAQFALSVQPESYALGGSAALELAQRSEGALTVVEVRATDAAGLRALYFELDYDAQRYAPVAVEGRLGQLAETDGESADAPAALELAVLDRPGTVHSGQVLSRAADRDGFTGAGVVAVVRFAPVGFTAAVRETLDAPTTNASRTTLTTNGTDQLMWGYYSQGDYDQNRETNIADLTPLGVNFQEAVPAGQPDSVNAVIDGDGNGLLTIADVTPIGANFQRRVLSYNIYEATSPAAYPASNGAPSSIAPLSSVGFESHTGQPTQGRLQFAATIAYNPERFYWVRPSDGLLEGTASTLLQPQSSGQPPEIVSLTPDAPTVAAEGSMGVTAVATDPDGDSLNYSWSASAGSISGVGASVLYSAPATGPDLPVTVTLTVDDGHGNFDTAQADLTVIGTGAAVSIVRLDFAPDAVLGAGTTDDPWGLSPSETYTFSAFDQDGNDITADVTFEAFAEPGQPPLPMGSFAGSVYTPEAMFSPNFFVVGTYKQGTAEEVASDPDAPASPMHFQLTTLPDP